MDFGHSRNGEPNKSNWCWFARLLVFDDVRENYPNYSPEDFAEVDLSSFDFSERNPTQFKPTGMKLTKEEFAELEKAAPEYSDKFMNNSNEAEYFLVLLTEFLERVKQ